MTPRGVNKPSRSKADSFETHQQYSKVDWERRARRRVAAGKQRANTMNLICVSAELMFASQVEAVAKKAGFQVKTAPGRDALLKLADTLGAAVVCLDLDSLDVDVAELLNDLESVATRPESVIAVAAHVHEGRLESAPTRWLRRDPFTRRLPSPR